MRIVDVEEAGAQLERLIDEARAGVQVVIARDGRPVVRLTPVLDDSRPRDLSAGYWRGRVHIAGDFDDPLPEGVTDAFEGEDD